MDTLPVKRIKDPLDFRLKGFATWSLAELIDYSVGNCHQPAKKEIAIIYDIAHVVAYKHSDKYPQIGKLTEILFLSFDNLLRHLRIEEGTFFPIVVQAFKSLSYPYTIEKAIPEYFYEMAESIPKAHEAIANDLEIFRELTGHYKVPDDGDFLLKYLFDKMKRLDREMSFHMRLENTILFPKAIALSEELNKRGCVSHIFWKERSKRSKLK